MEIVPGAGEGEGEREGKGKGEGEGENIDGPPKGEAVKFFFNPPACITNFARDNMENNKKGGFNLNFGHGCRVPISTTF